MIRPEIISQVFAAAKLRMVVTPVTSSSVTMTLLASEDFTWNGTVNMPVSQTCPTGSIIVVTVVSTAETPLSSVSDASSNTYENNVTEFITAVGSSTIYSAYVSTQLASGSNVTIVPAGYYAINAKVYLISAGNSGGHLDVTSSAENSSVTSHTTGTTSATSNNDEFAIALWSPTSGLGGYNLTNFTPITSAESAATGKQIVVGYKSSISSGTAISGACSTDSPTSSPAVLSVYKTINTVLS